MKKPENSSSKSKVKVAAAVAGAAIVGGGGVALASAIPAGSEDSAEIEPIDDEAVVEDVFDEEDLYGEEAIIETDGDEADAAAHSVWRGANSHEDFDVDEIMVDVDEIDGDADSNGSSFGPISDNGEEVAIIEGEFTEDIQEIDLFDTVEVREDYADIDISDDSVYVIDGDSASEVDNVDMDASFDDMLADNI